MKKILKQTFQNKSIDFYKRDQEIWVNATKTAQAFGKRAPDFLKNKSTIEYIEALMRHHGTHRDNHVKVVHGGANPGTWIRQDMAVFFARWLDPDFAVWCDEIIKQLLQHGHHQQSATAPKPVQAYQDKDIQLELSRQLNAQNYVSGGLPSVIEYNRRNCINATGFRPSELLDMAKSRGWPSKYRTSGKQVVRHARPHKACVMSAADDLVRIGIPQEKAFAVARQMEPYFKCIAGKGYDPYKLNGYK